MSLSGLFLAFGRRLGRFHTGRLGEALQRCSRSPGVLLMERTLTLVFVMWMSPHRMQQSVKTTGCVSVWASCV